MNIYNATLQDIPVIRSIAEQTWWPTYGPILSREQLQFMLDVIYSEEALRDAILQGQEFILIADGGVVQGFASFAPRTEDAKVYKLHKLYVLPGHHGKGYGKALLAEVVHRSVAGGAGNLDLNVNRFNPAIPFYERAGFAILREEDVPIGKYFMNDFVMRKRLEV